MKGKDTRGYPCREYPPEARCRRKQDRPQHREQKGVRVLTPRSNRKCRAKNFIIIIILARFNARIDTRNQVITILIYWCSFSIIIDKQLPTIFIYSRNAGMWWITTEIHQQFSLNMCITYLHGWVPRIGRPLSLS